MAEGSFVYHQMASLKKKKRNTKKQPAQVRHQHNNIRNASAQSIFNCISHHFSSDVCTNGSTFKKQQRKK
jgi:hypothetical protein